MCAPQGAGGALSREKGVWLVDATLTWFHENANLQASEVEDFLDQVTVTVFKTSLIMYRRWYRYRYGNSTGTGTYRYPKKNNQSLTRKCLYFRKVFLDQVPLAV